MRESCCGACTMQRAELSLKFACFNSSRKAFRMPRQTRSSSEKENMPQPTKSVSETSLDKSTKHRMLLAPGEGFYADLKSL